uniref:DUF7153 domain-containing protein n=1 Tax=Panagrolaimus superbus TaxID=310955 RepID=A0A914YLU6_9BILA
MVFTVFFGFIHNPSVNQSSNSSNSHISDHQFNGFTRDDYCLEKVLAECNTIKTRDGFRDGVLLKCIDSKPMFTYLHYALFQSGSAPRINNLIGQCDPSPKSQYGAFEELFAIQKSASSPDTSLPSNRHAGFIVSCFKLLDENFKQHTLEKSWLSWTGAREIYKYSPRNWNLRKITLHRHSVMNGKIRTFGYVLLCEFGNILHPSNTIQALDMCERLRARNCGHIALYQVQCNYGQPPIYSHPTTSIISNNHSSPTSLAPWGSPPTMSQQRASPKMAQRRNNFRNPMLRGYSQDVESTTETTNRRRSALLRLRGDHSIGYDMEEPPPPSIISSNNGGSGSSNHSSRFNNYQQHFEELA